MIDGGWRRQRPDNEPRKAVLCLRHQRNDICTRQQGLHVPLLLGRRVRSFPPEDRRVALILDPLGFGNGNHVWDVRLYRASDIHITPVAWRVCALTAQLSWVCSFTTLASNASLQLLPEAGAERS